MRSNAAAVIVTTTALALALAVCAACGVDDERAPAAAPHGEAVVPAELPGALEGQICDRRANDGVFALVTAVRDDDGLERATHTDAGGWFHLELPAGGYVASADAAGFIRAWGFDIEPGKPTRVPGCALPARAAVDAPIVPAVN